MRKYRVIQWATGAMGKTCLRAVLDNPQMELTGLFVYSDNKVGVDAGEIAKRDVTGVLATNNVDEILALDADIVIHTPRLQPPYAHHNETICKLLASGKNVISINGHSYPQVWGGDYLRAIEQACEAGNSSLFGSGLNPGFIAEKIATVASGLCLELEHIEVQEIVNCDMMKSPNYVFDVLGFASAPGAIDPNSDDWAPAQMLNGMYKEVVANTVQQLGMKLQRIETEHVMLPATADLQVAAGQIPEAHVSHTNWRWHGIVDDKCVLTHSIHWIMETAHLPSPDFPLWTVDIKGLPGVKISIDLNTPADHVYRTGAEQYAVAGSVLNSIPDVCSAPAGVFVRNMPGFIA